MQKNMEIVIDIYRKILLAQIIIYTLLLIYTGANNDGAMGRTFLLYILVILLIFSASGFIVIKMIKGKSLYVISGISLFIANLVLIYSLILKWI